MKIAYISTQIPRACGLATFNNNLKIAIEENLSVDKEGSYVVAINDSDEMNQYHYPKEVKYLIRQQNQKDYISAANFINNSAADTCILQHEFGIYGGDSGIYVLPLLNRIQKPLITILHTILQQPNYLQKLIIQEIAKQSSKVVVMAQKAVQFLIEVYEISPDKIELVQHGVPDYKIDDENPVKNLPMFKDKRVLLTFGLLSRNKGLETVIKALPAIVAQHPNVVYTIIGSTHPHVKKKQGEEYREYLKLLAKQ
jgi:glycosyltransferase involved in cell wall biosynthesis